jgi:Ni,Fe-hydrogenase I small subunit
MTPLRKSAQGEGCTMQVAGVCNHNPETVILAHLRWLGDCGGSFKPTDLQACFACSECNRWTDSPTHAETADRAQYESDRNFYALRAVVRTQLRMVAKGLITVKGMAA